jgi:hypothetical protein
MGQVTRGEHPPQPRPPHSWREWEIRLRATDVCVRDRSQCHEQGQLRLQGVGRTGEDWVRRVEEGGGGMGRGEWRGPGQTGTEGAQGRVWVSSWQGKVSYGTPAAPAAALAVGPTGWAWLPRAGAGPGACSGQSEGPVPGCLGAPSSNPGRWGSWSQAAATKTRPGGLHAQGL